MTQYVQLQYTLTQARRLEKALRQAEELCDRADLDLWPLRPDLRSAIADAERQERVTQAIAAPLQDGAV